MIDFFISLCLLFSSFHTEIFKQTQLEKKPEGSCVVRALVGRVGCRVATTAATSATRWAGPVGAGRTAGTAGHARNIRALAHNLFGSALCIEGEKEKGNHSRDSSKQYLELSALEKRVIEKKRIINRILVHELNVGVALRTACPFVN